jgi:site-specific recombinase XerD
MPNILPLSTGVIEDGFPLFQQRRIRYGANVQVLQPMQFPSLSHCDARVRLAVEDTDGIQELSPATRKWLHYGYSGFRAFLVANDIVEEWISGDLRRQAQVLDAWVRGLRGSGKKRASVSAYWRAVRNLFRRIAREDGLVNPFEVLPSPHPGTARLRCLTPVDAAQVLAFVQNDGRRSPLLRKRNAAIVGTMLLAGLRKSELLRVRVSDVDFTTRQVQVREGKGRFGGKPRVIPMNAQLLDVAATYAAERARCAAAANEYFFVANRAAKALGETSLVRLFRQVSRDTGIQVSPHVLRHTFCTLLSRAGVPDRLAKEAMGHADLRILQRYQHVYPGELAGAMEKLRIEL